MINLGQWCSLISPSPTPMKLSSLFWVVSPHSGMRRIKYVPCSLFLSFGKVLLFWVLCSFVSHFCPVFFRSCTGFSWHSYPSMPSFGNEVEFFDVRCDNLVCALHRGLHCRCLFLTLLFRLLLLVFALQPCLCLAPHRIPSASRCCAALPRRPPPPPPRPGRSACWRTSSTRATRRAPSAWRAAAAGWSGWRPGPGGPPPRGTVGVRRPDTGGWSVADQWDGPALMCSSCSSGSICFAGLSSGSIVGWNSAFSHHSHPICPPAPPPPGN